jgi:hypothetical protein
VRPAVGAVLGTLEGTPDGTLDGTLEGTSEGPPEGALEGKILGTLEGCSPVGMRHQEGDGEACGTFGALVLTPDGALLGWPDG